MLFGKPIIIVFIYRTEDNFEQEEPTQDARFSSEESLVDDEVTDATYFPEERSRRRESFPVEALDIDVDLGEDSCDLEVAGPSVAEGAPTQSTTMEAQETPGDQEQTEERRETVAQPARRATPTQARGREDATTPPLRRRGALPPTRRETESEMSGAVSGLLGILQSHQTLITRQLQDGDRGHIMDQYKAHISSLQAELEAVHGHYRDELKMMHEMHRGEMDQLRAQHHQSVGQLQHMMQQMHQQSKELLKLQAHPSFHTVMSLLPYLEKVPSQNMMACHTSVLEAIKQHMDTPLLQPPTFRHPQPTVVPPWQSSSQMYTGYRGSQYGPPLSGSSSSTTSTQESPDFQTSTTTFSSSGVDTI